MRFEIGFGTAPQIVTVPDSNMIGVLKSNEVVINIKGLAAVEAALARPIGSALLRDIVKPGEKTVIITSDITRPVPGHIIIPAILDELRAAGADMSDVTVVFALGIHRKHTPEEMEKLVGQNVYRQVNCLDSDPEDCIHFGTTELGTPVDITRIVAEADRRIGVGNIEYHYFAGYSGGAKAIMPGVSTAAAIQSNHSRMIQPDATAGRLQGNPVREDIESAMRLCPLDFIVNVVLDERKEVIHAVAGDAVMAHREGCKFLDSIYRCEIEARADIVIASQGGAPKDLNLYQTQKALDNAKHAVKNGGVIILVGSCGEGLGEEVFQEWMTTSKDPASMIERIKREFQLGGHKAAAIAMVLEEADIYLVSEMEPEFVKSIFLKPFKTVQEAFDAAIKKQGGNASVLVMPYAGSTLPVLR